MGKNYDNWGRLVEAVERRELLRRLSLADSLSTSPRSSFDSEYNTSFSSISLQQPADFSFRSTTQSPSKSATNNKVFATTRNVVLKGLSIFRGFSMKKEKLKEKEALYGIGQMENYQLVFQNDERLKRRADITRLRELHTLKGHIEALAKTKGIDLDSIHHYYTV